MTETPGVEQFANDTNAFFAIAQHYGIPTDYIDFTTDPGVAGYFACDTRTPEPGTDSCIYCLDCHDLEEVWNDFRASLQDSETPLPAIEFVTDTVPNLWRLEAQCGTFLYCTCNWSLLYGMDRILFPYTGFPAWPTREDIYPSRKSQLEILLDQYFMNEQLLIRGKEFRAFYESLTNPNKAWTTAEAPPNRVHTKYFVNGELPELASWSAERVAPWMIVTPESLGATQGTSIRLAVDAQATPAAVEASVSAALRRVLAARKNLRQTSVGWVLTDAQTGRVAFDEYIIRVLERVWDGMRGLPYADADVAEAFGTCVALHAMGFRKGSGGAFRDLASELFGAEAKRVEFGAPDGSYAQGFVTRPGLLGALRSDFEAILLPEYREFASNLNQLLQLTQATRRTFEFDKLVPIFAGQLIPTQALLITDDALKDGKGLVYFSPARVTILGLP